MSETIHFHTDLYRRDALEHAAEKARQRARIELADLGPHVVASLEPLAQGGDGQALRDEFCNDAFSETARRLRDGSGRPHDGAQPLAVSDLPPWELLAPVGEGAVLGLGWALESLSPVRGGAATMVLRHAQLGNARVAIRRNDGAPLGVAHTDQLDFMLMNGGSGSAHTEESVGRVLIALADVLRRSANHGAHDDLLATLLPHAEKQTAAGRAVGSAGGAAPGARRVAPSIDLATSTISFEIADAGASRLAVYEAVLPFADRAYVFLTRPDDNRITVQIRARGEHSTDDLRALAADLTRALNRVVRGNAAAAAIPGPARQHGGMPVSSPQPVDLEALLAELAAADPATLGIGYEPERGPGHDNLRVLNIRGTGACNSDCVWCVEKFDPTHRTDAEGRYDAPVHHRRRRPVRHALLRQRRADDPSEAVRVRRARPGRSASPASACRRTSARWPIRAVTLKILQAGFQYFDISLHAADAESQLAVNPIGDGGASLYEALKGLAVLYRLAAALGIRISITHKIVVSRLNVTRLEPVFRATYDRGVRHFILQPVRAMDLAPERQALLDISEDEIIPHLNELLRATEGLGAVVKPYGFSRQGLFSGGHVEYEQNRRQERLRQEPRRAAATSRSLRRRKRGRAHGRHWVEVRRSEDERCGFCGRPEQRPILDQALARGLELPFGCRMGSCGMCCARLLEGSVDQSSQIFLTEEQQRQGYVLLCQARALSDVTIGIVEEDELDPL